MNQANAEGTACLQLSPDGILWSDSGGVSHHWCTCGWSGLEDCLGVGTAVNSHATSCAQGDPGGGWLLLGAAGTAAAESSPHRDTGHEAGTQRETDSSLYPYTVDRECVAVIEDLCSMQRSWVQSPAQQVIITIIKISICNLEIELPGKLYLEKTTGKEKEKRDYKKVQIDKW